MSMRVQRRPLMHTKHSAHSQGTTKSWLARAANRLTSILSPSFPVPFSELPPRPVQRQVPITTIALKNRTTCYARPRVLSPLQIAPCERVVALRSGLADPLLHQRSFLRNFLHQVSNHRGKAATFTCLQPLSLECHSNPRAWLPLRRGTLAAPRPLPSPPSLRHYIGALAPERACLCK
ncbi:hypothetical protein BD309DRAFT_954135 [Dichomitus squalens]|uniref:Uncharacterized protein n=1 Tax=Dichomitus squalens TaxID=114155 RepID=A0A4Q9NX88_9APHY|nr:hypothetical protein BD309DRAFT_954135 [Dichomitus squalens]TBU65326.1 hypothetical protein BD310DRAFT_911162 [Dichomitus squalens]